ncbi:SDR family oxidoreductase [Tsuneonella mangrovi]|uniref:SDR family oxidoreductase n=1 Tax=Tsuneonella mangrovi TaxID=1982042 RepID=UPI000BA275DA
MQPLSSLFRLSDKVALVTGCRRGIGMAMAIGLAEAGADIIGVSANLDPDNDDVATAVRATGRSFTGYRCDFADRTALKAMIANILNEHSYIDILVNNAGTILRAPAADHSDEFWDGVIEVNLSAQFLLTREIGRRMIEHGSGKILFTASLLSYQGGINVPSYAASKGGIQQLTMAFANEWASKGINVNAIAPGYISTDNTEALRADPARADAILSRIPAGRWGEPDDFKGPAVFLASSASDYVNGATLLVDGGWMGR